MVSTDFRQSIKRRLPEGVNRTVNEANFYTTDKFALWIDLRSQSMVLDVFK